MKIPKGKRAPETSVESQVYIDTGKLPKAHPLKLFGYRILEDDDDGDPLDHGVLMARDEFDAATILAEHFAQLGFEDELETRLYPTQARTTPGVLESAGEYIDVTITPEGADGTTICECGRKPSECATADDEDAEHGDR